MTAPSRPVTVLIAALGGEGGGVLSKWIVDAAENEGHYVQSTSVPGVAQRTGATTYYIEVMPKAEDGGGKGIETRPPVLALTPSPGDVDVVVASELIEAGRAMQNGFVAPWRTTLVASTHRVYAIAEKSALGDGRYADANIHDAASRLAARAVLADMRALAREAGSAVNAVLLGAVAASAALPLSQTAFEAAIRHAGISVEANLRGFAAGLAVASGTSVPPKTAETAKAEPVTDGLRRRIEAGFPAALHDMLKTGAARLIDYQDAAYAESYLDRLAEIFAADDSAGGANRDYRLTSEAARHLALWMAFDDVIRVADLKTRPNRVSRVRSEVGARSDQLVAVSEYLKPGVDEWGALLPPWIGRPVLSAAARGGWSARLRFGIRLKTTTVSGFLALRLVALLRRWRRHTFRYHVEQARIGAWLERVKRLASADYGLALEIVASAGVVKGYGETHRRGSEHFDRLLERAAALAGTEGAAAELASLREAALADEDGAALACALEVSDRGTGRRMEAAGPAAAAGQ